MTVTRKMERAAVGKTIDEVLKYVNKDREKHL